MNIDLGGNTLSNGYFTGIATGAETVNRIMVSSDTARYALTTDVAKNGSIILVTTTGLYYTVADETQLSNSSGYLGPFSASGFNPGLEGLFAFRSSQIQISEAIMENLTFTAPTLRDNGVRFGGTTTSTGDYSGARFQTAFGMAGVGNQSFTTPLVIEFVYGGGANSSSVLFTLLLGTNNRRSLTAKGLGIAINSGNSLIEGQLHDGSTLTTATMGTSIPGPGQFWRRYLLVWDGLKTLAVYSQTCGIAYARPVLQGSVSLSANATGTFSTSELRIGLYATATGGGGQDVLIQDLKAVFY